MKTLPSIFYMFIFALAAPQLLLTGCLRYTHTRPVAIVATDGTDRIANERTTVSSLFKKGEAAAIESITIDNTNGYSRAVGANKIKTSGDPATIKATGGAVGEGAREFLTP